MKLQTLCLLGTAALGIASPAPVPEQDHSVEPAQLEARAVPYDALASYALNLVLKPIIGRGIDHFLGQSAQIVELSQSAFTAITNIVQEAIDEAWEARDRAKVETLIQNSRDYTRLNQTESQIVRSLAVAIDYHEEANLLLNHLDLYGIKAAPITQTMIGLYIAFKKEEIALTKDLDVLTNTANHLIKFDGFRTRLDELIAQLKSYELFFSRMPSALFRNRNTETGEWPCPACICKKRSHSAFFESRATVSSPWKVVREIQQTWPYCGKRPTDKINRHRAIVNEERAAAAAKWLVDKRDVFLTAGFEELVSALEDLKTWDVDRVISSLFVQDSSLLTEA